jgi:hypothetical protein
LPPRRYLKAQDLESIKLETYIEPDGQDCRRAGGRVDYLAGYIRGNGSKAADRFWAGFGEGDLIKFVAFILPHKSLSYDYEVAQEMRLPALGEEKRNGYG